jgi:hypothetical protein
MFNLEVKTSYQSKASQNDANNPTYTLQIFHSASQFINFPNGKMINMSSSSIKPIQKNGFQRGCYTWA